MLSSNRTVGQTCSVETKAGALFGVELEVEGDNLPEAPSGWSAKTDGSLRGENREYVSLPLAISPTVDNISKLYRKLGRSNTKIHSSGRCGLHVHVNCSDLTMNTMTEMAVLYLLLEDALLDFCGEGRGDNLHCLSSRNAEDLLQALHHCIKTGSVVALNSDEYRYASINFRSLFRFGTLEFRAMKAPLPEEHLVTWVRTLDQIRGAAVEGRVPELFLPRTESEIEEFILSTFSKDVLDALGFDALVGSVHRRRSELAPLLRTIRDKYVEEQERLKALEERKKRLKPGDVSTHRWRNNLSDVIYSVIGEELGQYLLEDDKGGQRRVSKESLGLRFSKVTE